MDLMMTGQPKPKSARKAKAAKQTTATGFVIDSDDPAVVAETLAKKLPEWESLTVVRRAELVQQSMISRARPTRAKIAVTNQSGDTQISPPEGEQGSFALTIYEAFATSSGDVVQTRLSEIYRHFKGRGADSAENINSALAFVGGCSPENEHQSAMATQMALLHDAALHALRCAGSTDSMLQYEAYSNQANKLSRTFATMTEAYAKLQRGGVQTVKHVNVYEGGQAVVADTVNTGGSNVKAAGRAHATGVGASMLGHDAQGNGVPIAGGEGQAALSATRRRQG
jgi:hypothetical protein